MSEQETEQTPEPVEPDEVTVTERVEPDTEPEPEVEPEPDTEPDPQPQPDGGANEENYRKLDTKADNYFKGVAKMLEGTDIPLVPCELCADAYPGVRWQDPQNDQSRAMLGIIGATASGSPLQDDPDAQLCDRCQGYGWTKLPSQVPGNTERLCRKCNGAGWLDTNPQSGAPVAPQPVPENGTAEPLPGVPADDHSVVDLRARGFTVIPPMQIGAVSEQ